MRKSKFSESQIVGILNEIEAGLKVVDVCRKHGVTQQTYYKLTLRTFQFLQFQKRDLISFYK